MKINLKIKSQERPNQLYPKRLEFLKQIASREEYIVSENEIISIEKHPTLENWMDDKYWVEGVRSFKKVNEEEWIVTYKCGEIIKLYLT